MNLDLILGNLQKLTSSFHPNSIKGCVAVSIIVLDEMRFAEGSAWHSHSSVPEPTLNLSVSMVTHPLATISFPTTTHLYDSITDEIVAGIT